MLRCRDGSLYTGWCTDLERRLRHHRAGRASRYTASRLPVELALALPMSDRSAARREEARIKALARARKLELVAGASGAIGHDGGHGQQTARTQREDRRERAHRLVL